MSRQRREIDEQLARLYAQVPAIPDCKGLCWISCGPADLADREHQRIRARGYDLPPSAQAKADAGEDTYWCPALTGDGKCAVYDIRPMVCRLWGTVVDMPCPYGCTPEFWLTAEQGFELAIRVVAVGGASQLQNLFATEDVDMVLESFRANRHGVRDLWAGLSRASMIGIGLRLVEHGQTLPPEVTVRPNLRERK